MSRLCLALLLFILAPVLQAQEGHPLVGTWQGTWGPDDSFLTLILSWDGEHISGIVNPGPDSTEIESAVVDSATWHVTLVMPLRDGNGDAAAFTLDGTLNNIGSRMRTYSGTWRYRSQSGNFTLERQSGA